MRKLKFIVMFFVSFMFFAISSFSATTEEKKPVPKTLMTAGEVDQMENTKGKKCIFVVDVGPTPSTSTEKKVVVKTPIIPEKQSTLSKKHQLQASVGLRLRSFNGLNTLSQPVGFGTTSSDRGGVSTEFFVELKLNRFALEYLPISNDRKLDMKFYGSGFGKINVMTRNILIGKFFPIDTPDYSISFGFGAEYTKLGDAVSMGGFEFPITGEGWSPVFQIGGQYHMSKQLSLEMDYEKSNLGITMMLPGVPDYNLSYTDRLTIGLMFRLF